MKCPTCKTPDLLMTERLGVEIDYCPQCRGVWLDRGELDKIIERSTQELASRQNITVPQAVPVHAQEHGYKYGHGDRHDYQGVHQSRKKSIWQELFD
jgi:Zn-finger nucleic acid-binding protein